MNIDILSQIHENQFVRGTGVSYEGEFSSIKKNTTDRLQPVYEAFMNAWEAFEEGKLKNGEITIRLYLHNDLLPGEHQSFEFLRIEIEDNAVGLNDENLNRLLTIRDRTKKKKNKGTGRIQYIHFFQSTVLESVYYGENQVKKYRKVELSNTAPYIQQNAFAFIYENGTLCKGQGTGTKVIFSEPFDEDDKNYYARLDASGIKAKILNYFTALLCQHQGELPTINIKVCRDDREPEEQQICKKDLPEKDKESSFILQYKKNLSDGKLDLSPQKEVFTLTSYKLDAPPRTRDKVFLVSKGCRTQNIDLPHLKGLEKTVGSHLLFLLSSDYIDQCDTDVRGNLELPTSNTLKSMAGDMFRNQAILLEDIIYETERLICENYPAIQQRREEIAEQIHELAVQRLCSTETVKRVATRVSLGTTENEIIELLNKEKANEVAQKDVAINKAFKNYKSILERLDPCEKEYETKLEESSTELTKTIAAENKENLARYLMRRKMVLDLLDETLRKHLDPHNNEYRIKEKFMHNLLFQRYSDNPAKSDLWLLDDSYLYFQGCSEKQFVDIKYNNKSLFNKSSFDSLDEDMKEFLNDRDKNRPDILLFPEEGKCIIIELKAPDVNVAEHLLQLNRYAFALANCTNDDISIQNFYGYLIGEKVKTGEMVSAGIGFRRAPGFDYWFHEPFSILDINGQGKATMYTEVIKYSTLLERARTRNKRFIDVLLGCDS